MADSNPIESWRSVVGFDRYEVSDSGGVRVADTGRERKLRLDRHGYPCLGLSVNGKQITKRAHILVLEAFVGPRPDGHEACHQNGVRDDNRIENLRWGTKESNTLDKIRHGRSMRSWRHKMVLRPPRGEDQNFAKLTEKSVREIRSLKASGASSSSLARQFGVNESTIHRVVNRKFWAHVV